MKPYFQHIFFLGKRLLLALALFFAARVFFLMYNYEVFTENSFYNLVYLFILGVRFDLSVVVYFNIVFILMHAIPLGIIKTSNLYQAFLKWYFLVINGLLLFVNLSDSIYFNFILKRSTADVLKLIMLGDDVRHLLPSFALNYWYVPVIWAFLLVGAYKVYPVFKTAENKKSTATSSMKISSIVGRFLILIAILGLALIGGRGGIQKRPLAIMHASKFASPMNVPIVLNTPFAMMTTYGHDVLDELHYYSDEKAQALFPTRHHYQNSEATFSKKNVVILLLESFSRGYNGYLNNYEGYTPFLDSLMQKSLVFPNAYSSGLRSIDAIPAIVSGLPILMNDPFITSVYSTNAIESWAEIFNKEAYQTAFFHGGNNGTMDFDGFAGYAGFQEYHGRNEYGNSDDYDGFWGIFDGPFLQYVAHQLDGFQEPFFAFEFTLSSHNPYRVPEVHEGRFAEGDLRIHKVVRYTDYALMKFFETASQMSWYDNTIFVIVADHPAQHTLPSEQFDEEEAKKKPPIDLQHFYANTVGRFSIPLLVFAPGDTSLTGIDSTTIQQTDIMPSILDYLNYKEPFFAYGNSVFDDEAQHLAVHFTNGIYQITQGAFSLEFDGEKSLSLYDNVSDPRHLKNLKTVNPQMVDHLESLIKSILQQYHNRHINNRLTLGED